MSLPSSSAPCAIPDDACCTILYDVASHLLTSIYDTLSECYDDECYPAPLPYVTFGFGDDGIRDALTVAIQQVNPSPVTTAGRGGTTVDMGLYRCIYEVRLRESGWPMAHGEGQEIVPPDPNIQNQLARHAFAHGELMYRKIQYMLRTHTLTPTNMPQFSNAIVGALLPLNPLGGVVGFTCSVQIDLPWNWGGS